VASGVVAAQYALRVGEWLLLARKHVSKGEWILWCEANFESVSYKTLKRWMLASERIGHMSNAGLDSKGLRQIYLLGGIIESQKPNKQEDVTGNGHRLPETLSSAILPFIRWERRVFRRELETANRTRLEQWREQLKPAHEAYLVVEGKLQ
jgi:hypothetical protein